MAPDLSIYNHEIHVYLQFYKPYIETNGINVVH